MNKQITFATGCSGIGAPEVAWHNRLGWHPVFCSEIEKFPCAVLRHHWPDVPNLGDFTKIDGSLYSCDVFMAGTPCQSFSFAGKRQGLNDDRGNLTLTYVDIVHAIRDLRYACWENVPGALSDKTNAFGCLLGGLVGADDPLVPCDPPMRGKSNQVWRWIEAGRYPVLDEDGNETGEFTDVAEGHFPVWPGEGMAEGPIGRSAWRLLDAQYFGLPQRRLRLFLVFCPTAGRGDPASVLFERKGLSGHSAPSRQQGEEASGTLTPGAHPGGFNGQDAYAGLLGPAGDIAGTLSARTTGGGGLGTDFDLAGGLQPVELPINVVSDDLSPERGAQEQHSHRIDSAAVVATYLGNAEGGATELPYVTLSCRGKTVNNQTPLVGMAPVAFTANDHGNGAAVDLSPTLRPGGSKDGHQNGGVAPAIAFAIRGREGGANIELEGDMAGAKSASSGGSSRSYVASYGDYAPEVGITLKGEGFDASEDGTGRKNLNVNNYGVRRLSPTECHRLQGFPDDHCAVQYLGKPAADGPQYKALGNSMAVDVIEWIGRRIEADIKRVDALND